MLTFATEATIGLIFFFSLPPLHPYYGISWPNLRVLYYCGFALSYLFHLFSPSSLDNNESTVGKGFIQTIKHARCVGHEGLQISEFLNWTQEMLIWGFSATTKAWLNTKPLPHCSDSLGKFETRGSSNESWLPGEITEPCFEGKPASS